VVGRPRWRRRRQKKFLNKKSSSPMYFFLLFPFLALTFLKKIPMVLDLEKQKKSTFVFCLFRFNTWCFDSVFGVELAQFYDLL
jgi:hypothetical protein